MSEAADTPDRPDAGPLSEAEATELICLREQIAGALRDLRALRQEARQIDTTRYSIDTLTDSVAALSSATQDLNTQLKTFAAEGKPLLTIRPPVPLRDRLIVAAFFLLGLFVVGMLVFKPAAAPPPSDAILLPPRVSDLSPRRPVPVPPPAAPPAEEGR